MVVDILAKAEAREAATSEQSCKERMWDEVIERYTNAVNKAVNIQISECGTSAKQEGKWRSEGEEAIRSFTELVNKIKEEQNEN